MIDALARVLRAAMFHVKHSRSSKPMSRSCARRTAARTSFRPRRSTHLWDRHILDSAQLVRFEPRAGASWVDIGSGAGLPGIVIACLVEGPVTLIEPRRLRAEFLHKVCESLGLERRGRSRQRPNALEGKYDVITARAVAPLAAIARDIRTSVHKKNRLGASQGPQRAAELAEARAGVARCVPRGTECHRRRIRRSSSGQG